MSRVCITIPGLVRGKGRPRFGQGRTFTDPATVNAEAWIRTCAEPYRPSEPMAGALAVRLEIAVAVPASWSARRRAEALEGNVRPTGRPDLDNSAKLHLDALNGLMWRDDAQVADLSVSRHYAEAPGAVLTVEVLPNHPASPRARRRR